MQLILRSPDVEAKCNHIDGGSSDCTSLPPRLGNPYQLLEGIAYDDERTITKEIGPSRHTNFELATDIVIVGTGLIGLAIALDLHERSSSLRSCSQSSQQRQTHRW